MALMEGFRVKNYRALRDVTIGRVTHIDKAKALTPLTAVIGKNGAGKSTLFDAFGFLSDCLASDVESACDMRGRGGFDRLRSMGERDAIGFEVYYREASGERPITYHLDIDLDENNRPYVAKEILLQRRKKQKYGKPYPFLRLENGRGVAWAGREGFSSFEAGNMEERSIASDEEDPASVKIGLTDKRKLGIETLGTLADHPRIGSFREFLKGWYLSYFTPDAARNLSATGPQKHLNMHGDNIGNVVQYLEREHPTRLGEILERIAGKIPGISDICTHVTEDKRVLLRFDDGAFRDPLYAQQMSDGTLKIFAYLLMLEDPSPPPFICIEEPENGLYHKLLEILAKEFRDYTAKNASRKNASQFFVTTHQPYFVNALGPEEVWVLEKGEDGFSTIHRASDFPVVSEMVGEGLPLGDLWYSDYLDK